jgi:hypothetical protein
MAQYSAANSQQRSQWNRFVSGVEEINRRFAKTRADLYFLDQAVTFYKSKKDGAFPASLNSEMAANIQSVATRWMQSVNVLNNAFALSQSGSAYIVPSKAIDGDLDLIVEEGTVPEAVRNNATFSKNLVPDSELGWVIPVLIGATVIASLVLISGMVDSVTDTIVKHKKLDSQIQRIRSNVEKEMSKASPEIAKQWFDLKKKEVEPVEKGFLASAGSAAGGLLGIALIGIVLFMVWKNYGGKK